MTDFEKNENMIELDAQDLEAVSGGKGKGGSFIKTTGNVYVRRRPDREAGELGSLPSGAIVSYLGATSKDERGVAWYKINFNGEAGWVSSKYAKFK